MAISVTESQNNALVRKAIGEAQAHATSDAEFVRILRASYFASHPLIRRQLPLVRRNARAIASTRGVTADPSFHIYEDARFLENARALALRTAKKLRIMGGTKVASTSFPDCVAVGDDTDWSCTGTLIAPDVVVSAGHCAGVATRVFFGNDVTKKGSVVRVERAVRHPAYNKSKNNDLLLLILEKRVKVRVRRLAKSALIDKSTDGRAVGFGNVDATGSFGYGTKRQVDVPIASSDCLGKVSGRTDAMAYGCDRDLELVAGKPLLGRDSCNGDSGGPFYVSSGKTWLLAGATSRATKSAMSNCGDGGIYVRLDRYREWIEDTAEIKLP
jgi:secreted trypsin-like serine protease